jgi:hypothetical protein
MFHDTVAGCQGPWTMPLRRKPLSRHDRSVAL